MSDSARRQLLVEVGRCLFAADADEVREVIDPAETTPVPGAVRGVLGLMNLRGEVIVAGELGAFLGVDAEPGEESALVVFADGDRRIALLVDRVIGMAPSPESEEDVDSDLFEKTVDYYFDVSSFRETDKMRRYITSLVVIISAMMNNRKLSKKWLRIAVDEGEC